VICPRCGSNKVKQEKGVGPHWRKEVCANCGYFIRWVPKSKERKPKRVVRWAVEIVAKHYKMDKPRCFFCGRTQEMLFKNERLTVDHIIPLEEGGEDKIHNLQILCTFCHSLKNIFWVYLYKHLKESLKDEKNA